MWIGSSKKRGLEVARGDPDLWQSEMSKGKWLVEPNGIDSIRRERVSYTGFLGS